MLHRQLIRRQVRLHVRASILILDVIFAWVDLNWVKGIRYHPPLHVIILHRRIHRSHFSFVQKILMCAIIG